MSNWTRDALRLNLPQCPKCAAAKGDPCRTPSGSTTKPHQERGTTMRTDQTKYTGAFGATVVSFTPALRRRLEFDVTNCPHCGTHHASLDAERLTMGAVDQRVIVRCPATGGRPIEVIIRLFLNVP